MRHRKDDDEVESSILDAGHILIDVMEAGTTSSPAAPTGTLRDARPR
jgi:hypothetical protein